MSGLLSLSAFQQEGEAESYEEDDAGAEDDSKVGVQVDAWEAPHVGQRYPGNDANAAEAAQEGCEAVDSLWNATQEEESEHTSREDARQRPPGIDDALYTQHGDGHNSSQNTYAETAEANNGKF